MSSIIQTTVHLSNARKESQISKDENQDQNAGKKNGRKEAKIIQQQGIKVLIKNPNNLFKIVPTRTVFPSPLFYWSISCSLRSPIKNSAKGRNHLPSILFHVCV
jgi:hypothetical protein